MPGGMRGTGGRGPSPKNQLASLVTKLDQLTGKPLGLNLTDEQRTKIREQIQGLGDAEDLSDEEAQKRLDALLKIVEGDKDTLEAAGYRWPGEQGGGRGAGPGDAPKNPFKEGASEKHLKDLQDHLSGGKKS
jgi:hypothetical protein